MSAVLLPEGGRLLAGGLGFTEGPVAEGADAVLVTSVNRGHVYRVPLDGSPPALVVETGGGPNGLAFAADGGLYVAQNGGTAMASRSTVPAAPSLQRWAGGTLTTVLAGGVDAPSDCVVGPDGRLWFTDPAEHALEGDPEPGRLRTWDPATGELAVRRDGLLFPNGLAFTADRDRLLVAETTPGRISRFRVGDGGCEPDGWSVTLPVGKPDGMALDVEGWLWVASSVGHAVLAVDPAGEVRDRLHLGDGALVTSVCFAGPDLRTLVMTVAKGGSVLAVPARHPGLPLPVRSLSEVTR